MTSGNSTPRLIRNMGRDKEVQNELFYNNRGSTTPGFRIAQACDRCRLKKTKCDGKIPQCSQCALVGFECRISDKLNRKSFPRGYTETLEERVRELETENKRLLALCEMKEKNTEYQTTAMGDSSRDHSNSSTLQNGNGMLLDGDLQQGNGMTANVVQCPSCGNSDPNHSCVHLKPVVSNIITDANTEISFEQNVAPGLPAVQALNSMSKREESAQLAMLVSLALPRSTEEILFIPQLMANIQKCFGFASKQSLYTVSLLSSLKKNLPSPSTLLLNNYKPIDFQEPDDFYEFFNQRLKLNVLPDGKMPVEDKFMLEWSEVEELIEIFFKNCSNNIPIFTQELFVAQFIAFRDELARNRDELFLNYKADAIKISFLKIFATIVSIMCQMGLVTKLKRTSSNIQNDKTKKTRVLVSHYDRMINDIASNKLFTEMSITTIQSLQLLALTSFYLLNTGDIPRLYQLRGTIVSMAQQLRLHRCPSAVLLSASGARMQKNEQGERRLLFWAVYYLDVFYSLQLGVPRLLKDHEIECALPVSVDEDSQLEGRVSSFSLAITRYAKVLGNILDSIFKRNMMSETATEDMALLHESALDNWRNKLPDKYSFHLEANGTVNIAELEKEKQKNSVETVEKVSILVFYFLAKCMVHLPVIATKSAIQTTPSNNTNGKSKYGKENTEATPTRVCSSYILMQKATSTMLQVLHLVCDEYLPLPINVARTKARFALLTGCSAVEYLKGGSLYVETKSLLESLVLEIEVDRKLDMPGIISWHSLKILDMALMLLLQPPSTKAERLDKLVQKKLNYYNRLMGLPAVKIKNSNKSIEKATVEKKRVEKEVENLSENTSNIKKQKISSDTPLNADNIIVKKEGTDNLSNIDISGNNKGSYAFSFSSTDLSALFNTSDGMFKSVNDNLASFTNPNIEVKNTNMADSNTKKAIPVKLEDTEPHRGLEQVLVGNKSRNTSFSKLMLLFNGDAQLSNTNISRNLNSEKQNNQQLFSEQTTDNPLFPFFENQNQQKNDFLNVNGNYAADYDFIIDASLGLAPLLSDNKDVSDSNIMYLNETTNNRPSSSGYAMSNNETDQQNTISSSNWVPDINNKNNENTSSVSEYSTPITSNFGANQSVPLTADSSQTSKSNNERLFAAHKVKFNAIRKSSPRTESSTNENKKYPFEDTVNMFDEDTLTMNFGEVQQQRRPRRYPNYNSNLNKDSLALNTKVNGGRTQANLSDLFQWQNSK
ncbi:Regulatory protein CAT8 [Nakaseomyces bracarensis]|uniref:Regulatory protein CAT8 n=1 Tax=Nakaseomyces bracarensis TaxID=273131 RepID=A0ABR4NZ61_9SACH